MTTLDFTEVGTGRQRRAGWHLALIGLLLAVLVPAWAGSWSSTGPYGGKVNALLAGSNGKVYAGTDYGVFASSDGGLNWRSINEQSPLGGAAVYALQLDRRGNLYAASSVGIYHRVDGTTPWQAATDASLSKLPVHALAVDARDVVWAGSDKGVYRSVDGGVSWQAAGKLEAAVTALQIDAQGVIYAASYAGVFKSRDGSSWESINQGIGIAGYPVPPHVNALALDTRGNLYAATSSQFGFLQILGGGVYKSSNGGASWAAVNRGLSSSENNAFDITALVTDRAGNLLAASPGFDSLNPYSGGGIFRSSDGDSGWLATGQAGLSDLRVYALALDANGRLYAGLGQGIARSDDGGASWRDASQGLSNLTVSKMVSDAAGRLFALSEQGLSRSVDGGRSWQHVASEASRGNRTILDIHADAQSPVYAAGKAVSTSIGATGTFYHEIMVLYSSSDGGASWQDLKPWYHEACAAIARSADGKVYCGDEYGRVYRIDGRHESGVLVAGSFGEGPVRKLLADSRGDLLALLKERVYRSSDGAISWQPLEPAPGLKRINAMLTDAAGTIYLAGEGGVYKSPNGNGWQALNLGLGGAAVDAMAIDANQQLYVANRLGVYQLGAIDQFWSRLAVLPGDAPVTALLVSTDAIFVGTRAAGIYRYDPAATPVNARLLNVSARANMQLGDKVGIAGFVIKGGSKTVLITARGPSLTGMGVGGALADPKLRVVDASGRVIASNDNIGVGDNSPVAGRVEGLPTDARESALLLTLPAGAYSAVMEGVNGSTGVGLLAVDTVVNPQETGSVINLSFRGDVGAGDNVVIAGFIIVGGSKNVLLTARGPSLAQAGVSGVLARPMLELRDARGALISSNAGLGNAPNLAAIHATGMAPANADESAILQQLPEGAYSVIARGLNGGQGVVLMAVEQVD